MKNSVKLGFCALAAAVLLVGCGDSGPKDDGIKPEAKQTLADANSLAKKVDGNYDKLSDKEKQVFLGMANNDEPGARRLTMMMAHPPNEANKGKGGADKASAPTGKPGG